MKAGVLLNKSNAILPAHMWLPAFYLRNRYRKRCRNEKASQIRFSLTELTSLYSTLLSISTYQILTIIIAKTQRETSPHPSNLHHWLLLLLYKIAPL